MAANTAPRAVVVDDSHFMRTVITEILESGGVPVVGQAADGEEAVRTVDDLEPDVVTMDVEMPGTDGLEAVERIMTDRPTPILMLSAHTDGEADVTFDALEKGAIDFFTKPGGEVSVEMAGFEEQLVEKVTSVARADVSGTNGVSPPGATGSTDAGAIADAAVGTYVDDPTLIVGSSTGGPGVVENLLADLPTAADLRVVVVQHMPDSFTGRFADRLDDATDYTVREARGGDRLGGGEVVVAKGGRHLVVSGYRSGTLRLEFVDDPPVNGVRPAIDVTMESAAAAVDDPLVGVVLTGMGRDGAAGVEAIAEAGGWVVAQDEPTSAVFGMPKRAIETGRVDAVLPAGEIASGVLDHLSNS